jgi:glycosyltransferase involved in cell wall biosynthesis
MIEALASGVPVAGFPVRGPVDIIGLSGTGLLGGGARIGALDVDLESAMRRALSVDRAACAAEGRRYGWNRCTDQFFAGLVPTRVALAA